jgi:hypothetical protein
MTEELRRKRELPDENAKDLLACRLLSRIGNFQPRSAAYLQNRSSKLHYPHPPDFIADLRSRELNFAGPPGTNGRFSFNQGSGGPRSDVSKVFVCPKLEPPLSGGGSPWNR